MPVNLQTQQGTEVLPEGRSRSAVVRVVGVDPNSAAGRELLAKYGGAIRQFYGRQSQNQSLSLTKDYKATVVVNEELQLTYHRTPDGTDYIVATPIVSLEAPIAKKTPYELPLDRLVYLETVKCSSYPTEQQQYARAYQTRASLFYGNSLAQEWEWYLRSSVSCSGATAVVVVPSASTYYLSETQAIAGAVLTFTYANGWALTDDLSDATVLCAALSGNGRVMVMGCGVHENAPSGFVGVKVFARANTGSFWELVQQISTSRPVVEISTSFDGGVIAYLESPIKYYMFIDFHNQFSVLERSASGYSATYSESISALSEYMSASVAVCADGTTIAYGVVEESGFSEPAAGATDHSYVKILEKPSNAWTVTQIFTAPASSGTSYDLFTSFGTRIDLSASGGVIAIGASDYYRASSVTGAVFVAEKTNGVWGSLEQVVSPLTGTTANLGFGRDVSLSSRGDRLAATTVYVYRYDDGSYINYPHVAVFDRVNGAWQYVASDAVMDSVDEVTTPRCVSGQLSGTAGVLVTIDERTRVSIYNGFTDSPLSDDYDSAFVLDPEFIGFPDGVYTKKAAPGQVSIANKFGKLLFIK